jgi:hypothetical protein
MIWPLVIAILLLLLLILGLAKTLHAVIHMQRATLHNFAQYVEAQNHITANTMRRLQRLEKAQ